MWETYLGQAGLYAYNYQVREAPIFSLLTPVWAREESSSNGPQTLSNSFVCSCSSLLKNFLPWRNTPRFQPISLLSVILHSTPVGFRPFMPPKPLLSKALIVSVPPIQGSLVRGHLTNLLSKSPHLGQYASLETLHSFGICDCSSHTFSLLLHQLLLRGTLCWLPFFARLKL